MPTGFGLPGLPNYYQLPVRYCLSTLYSYPILVCEEWLRNINILSEYISH